MKNNQMSNKIKIANIILATAILIIILFTILYIKLQHKSNNDINVIQPTQVETQEQTQTEVQTKEIVESSRSEIFQGKINNIDANSRLEWYLSYKALCNEYSDVYDYNKSIYYNFSEAELIALFKVVQLEIGHYSFEQKANVASVIFNRLDHYKFPDNILDILSPDQFSTVDTDLFYNAIPNDEVILACEYAWEIERTNNCLFFDSNGVLGDYYGFVFSDGAHNFYSLD